MSGNTTVIDIVAQVTDQTASGAKSAEKNVGKLEKAMQSLQQRITAMQGKSKLEIAANLKDMASAGLQKIASAGKNLAGKAWTVTMKLKDLVTAPFRGILKMLTNPIVQIATITGLSLGVADTIDTYKTFQQGMANVQAIANASDEDLNRLTATAKELGETTMFSAVQASEAMENLAMAGWKVNDIISGMPGLLSLAAAGSVDLATASDVVSSAIAQFKLEASEAAMVADVLAATATNSKTDVAGLGESLKYAGTMAGSLGYSIKDTALALGLMGNAGVDASSAGSTLRMMFARMSKQEGLTAEESNAVADAMRKVGVSLTKENGEMYSMIEVLGQLRTGFAKLDAAEQAATAANLAGAYSMTGLLAIVNAADDDFNDLAEAIYNSEGAASRMADIKMDTLQGSMYYLQSAAEGVKIAIGEKLEPYLRGFIDWLTSKMPAIKNVAMDAMDFLGNKIQGVQIAIDKMTQSAEWAAASTTWDKIKVAWNKLIAEPFDEWWNTSGRSWLAEKANGVGQFVGNFIKTGFLTLLGVDVDGALNDGMLIGKSFMDGFIEGFDAEKVVQGILKAFKAIGKDALSLFSGNASSTAGLSAALLGFGAIKAGTMGYKLFKGGKALVTGAKGIFTALNGAGAAGTAAAGTAAVGRTAVMSAGLSGGGLGTTIAGALGVAGVLTAAIGGAAIAMKVNSEKLDKIAKETIDGMLFDNGGTKLSDYTAKLKESTAETYNLAKKINYTTVELNNIEAQMQEASTSVQFFGTSLRETGTISQQEAKNMYEPFNQLCESLESDFTIRYNNVFDAFKLAAVEVADNLGADIATISSTLDTFKEKYLGSINNSQEKVNSLLEKQAGGENLSSEELEQLQTELGKIAAYAGSEKSESQYKFEQTANRLGKIDLGKNQYEAMSAIGELTEYSNAYISELTEALNRINLDYENLRGKANTGLAVGDLTQEEYDNFLEALNKAQAITVSTYTSKIEEQQRAMSEVREQLRSQIDKAVRAATDDMLNAPGAWFSLEALAGVFGGDTYYAFYNKAQGQYQELIDSVTNMINTTSIDPVLASIPVDVQLVMEEISGKPITTTPSTPSTTASEDTNNHSSTGGRHRANGGILSSPEIALVAEDGAEAIIPLTNKRRDRGISLWRETGRMLGVREYAEGGIVGALPSGSGGSSTRVTIDLGGIDMGGFNINVDGSASPEDIVEAIRANLTMLTDEVANELAERLTAVFVNMPVKATG